MQHKRLPTCLYIFVLFLFDGSHGLSAQKQNHVWYFGNSAGLDFKSAPPTPLLGEISTVEGVASIADQNGGLLFYTDGTFVWDRTHSVMPNGDGLAGGFSSTQSAVIVPLPNSCTKYYLFTAEDQFTDGGVAFSVIDMALHNGYGDIISSTKNTSMVEKTAEKLTATIHANGTDVWILTHTLNSNDFYAFLLTENGLNLVPVVSSVGTVYGENGWYNGPIRMAHDGTRIVHAATYSQMVEILDFDNATGQVTNPQNLYTLFDDERIYGVEFSPNDSLLYLGSASFNLDANQLSQVQLYSNPLQVQTIHTLPLFSVENFGTLQLGPDGKVYMARNRRSALDIIHQPDKVGVACQFVEGDITLYPGTGSTFGLPNPAPYSFCPTFFFGSDTTLCNGDTLSLAMDLKSTETCPVTFFWNDGTSDTIKTISTPGLFWVELTNNCLTYRDSIEIRFDSIIYATLDKGICEGDTFENYSVSGTYVDTFTSVKGCDSVRTLNLSVHTASFVEIYETIYDGFTFEGYRLPDVYRDTFQNTYGCDSIRVLYLNVIYVLPLVEYSLDSCVSVMDEGTHMDYTEFTPVFPFTLPCASVSADFLYRAFPEKHSCTPGFDGSPAMCVTSLDSCEYQPGHEASVIIEFTIDPLPDSVVHFSQFSFYEKGPLQYEWTNGPSGQNNRPLQYGIRILKNGVPVFEKADNPTNVAWSLQTFDFLDIAAFYIDSFASFRIELLPYCRIGNNATESVWDLDEITIYGGCVSPFPEEPIIDGFVINRHDKGMANVSVELSTDPLFAEKQIATTDEEGYYDFHSLARGRSYYLRGYKNDDPLNGVTISDLISIQKNLLGITSFTSLDQLVAADANRNNTINVLDLITLQKLLLGKYTKFPNNTSWRFALLPQDFESMDLSLFQEIKFIESLQGDAHGINFVGIKTGDVNGDARNRGD
jgi:hypothetical protein